MPKVSCFSHATLPDTSGNVFSEPYTVKATNDNWKHSVFVFNDTATKIGLYFKFEVPSTYSSGANFAVVWTSTATAGDWEIDLDYRAVGGNDSESLDQATAQESLNVNDTAPSAAHERMEADLDATDGNFAAEDTVEGVLWRDGTDAGDTMAAAVMVFDLLFEFTE
jgi:hypothetical protein